MTGGEPIFLKILAGIGALFICLVPESATYVVGAVIVGGALIGGAKQMAEQENLKRTYHEE